MECRKHLHAQLGYDVLGACIDVYRTLGPGFTEEVYEEALHIELRLRYLKFDAQVPISLFYKGTRLQRSFRPDLLVEGQLIVELKALSQLVGEHEAQLLNYLKSTRKPVGYLVNFGNTTKLEWKRFILSLH